MTSAEVLRVEELTLHFRTRKGVVQAVDRISFSVPRNGALAVLGESGCGKSSLARAILRLLPRNVSRYSGQVYLDGRDLMAMDDETFRREIRWSQISFVPQASMNALNPVLRVGDQVAEPAMLHLGLSKPQAIERAAQMLSYVGVPQDFIRRYPFELSGGMRQRVAIAMALITYPALVILDEPTSALDLLTQANIMNLLKGIKNEMKTSYILITHDIATASELADQMAIMYAGQIVELSDAKHFFHQPLHPYSQRLLAAVPRLRGHQAPEYIPGQPPSLIHPPAGCRFADRCSFRFARCDLDPPLFNVEGRQVKCWLYE
ncbi:MAG: ABC transporter ATP-binding protein [Anaerolineae bacterium]|nr:ABC transporter ATP-binding protein [Thermoflexus sp.]MDW8064782.1 ABC transporter ATP-binding protein [Anaerolineae bacterium]